MTSVLPTQEPPGSTAAPAAQAIDAVKVYGEGAVEVRALDHITIVPQNDAIDCEHVTINYRDGTSHDVFSGCVAAGAHTTISLPPPNDGRVADVTFACKAQHLDGARIVLSAVTDAWPQGWDSERPAHVTTEAHPD